MDKDFQSLVLPAPAKLNLFLHIVGRREDGYHQLQTVFQLLDYSDEISLTPREDGLITRVSNESSYNSAQSNYIPLESDLCIRAAKLLQSQLKSRSDSLPGVEINLKKILPIGGGVGGGSSDAATVLCGLNKLWGCNFNNDKLADLGIQLGADVPVFIRGHTAWAEGIGEQLTPLQLQQQWYLVIHPNIFVSTADIFADQGLTRDCDTLKIARFLEGNRSNFLSDEFSNVFASVVEKKYPEIANVIDWLSAYSPARLTGTGACVFAAFDSKNAAEKVLDVLSKSEHDWSGFVAKGVNESPLNLALQKENI